MINDYFYQLNFTILTVEEKKLLQEFVNVHNSTFIDNVSRQGNKDGNQLFPELGTLDDNLIQSLKSKINIPCRIGMVRQLPSVTVAKHTDGAPFRRTVLIIPLLPETEYPPTYFWETLEDSLPIAQAVYENMNPCLINTKKIHNVANGQEVRANLQFCFEEDISVVREMIINNTLFR